MMRTAYLSGLSIVIPVLNEAGGIAGTLAALAGLRQNGAEVIVVDGGSTDGTVAAAERLADRVLSAEPGRAWQMNAGAEAATGEMLLFLHADTVLPDQADVLIAAALVNHAWGRFDVRITGTPRMLCVIAAMMNMRSRLTGIATGDQAIFVRRAVFIALGGFPAQPLMEDIEFSRRARLLGRPACLREKVLTSGRRWEKHGIWRTIVLMWRLRLAYFLGASPERLAIAYGYRPDKRKNRISDA